MYRGSRKHVLDWLEQPEFLPELLRLLQPVDARITSRSTWSPTGYRDPDEARLETWGPKRFGEHAAWQTLRRWWLAEPGGANTPNWDLVLVGELEGRTGLVLVEAKAHVGELSVAGKTAPGQSDASHRNHDQIGKAIAAAREALAESAPSACPNLRISRDLHYQLSNRIAFTWKLASLGVPVALVYLGFTGDSGIRDVSPPFQDAEHWRVVLQEHLEAVGAERLFEQQLGVNGVPFWLLSRARPVLETSPPAKHA